MRACSVVSVPELVSQISPGRDHRALRMLTAELAGGGYDIVHTHSAKAGALGRLAAERAGTPRVVHTFHGFPFHEFQSRARRRRTSASSATSAAAPTSSSPSAARWRPRRCGGASPCPSGSGSSIRRSSIAASPASPAVRAAARRRLGVPVGCKVVGTVGRVDYQKAPESFVDAIAALDRADVYAVWIGDGPLRREMERRAERRGLQHRFRCVGHRDDVPALLPGLDVFVMASRYEGLPCAVAEAMTVGLPVVATAVNAVPDVVLPGETGLLAGPERPQQLAAAIRLHARRARGGSPDGGRRPGG